MEKRSREESGAMREGRKEKEEGEQKGTLWWSALLFVVFNLNLAKNSVYKAA